MDAQSILKIELSRLEQSLKYMRLDETERLASLASIRSSISETEADIVSIKQALSLFQTGG